MRSLKHALAAAAVAALAILTLNVPFAAADTVGLVTPSLQAIPWGKWLSDALMGSEATIVLVVGALVAKYVPAGYRLFLTQSVIQEAVHYAVATVSGAVMHDVWSVQTTNSVIAQAEAYVIANEKKFADQLGGLLRPKIVAEAAKLGLVPAEADAAALKAALPAPKAV